MKSIKTKKNTSIIKFLIFIPFLYGLSNGNNFSAEVISKKEASKKTGPKRVNWSVTASGRKRSSGRKAKYKA